MQNQQESEFAAAPRVVKPKNKYQDKEPEEMEEDEIKLIYNNLMWDKRVVRGNTYSALVTTSKNPDAPYTNTAQAKPKTTIRQDPEEYEDTGSRRANIEIFTDEFVETLTDKPPRYEYGAQTEFVIDNPVVRHRMPVKIGSDRETQIWDNELFDFDYEVEPLLSVLCGRTLEIARMEVLQEEELAIMRNRQLELHLEEEQERKKIKGMYDKEDQLQKQNAKRLENYRKDRQKKVHTHQRLFSRVLAKNYLRDLKIHTLGYVEGQGYFRNQIDSQLVDKFLPGLYSQSFVEQGQIDIWRKQAQQIVQKASEGLLNQHKKAKEAQKQRRNKILAHRAELLREKGERKLMKEEEKYMVKFLQDEKVELQRLQEEKRKAQEEGQAAEGEQKQAAD